MDKFGRVVLQKSESKLSVKFWPRHQWHVKISKLLLYYFYFDLSISTRELKAQVQLQFLVEARRKKIRGQEKRERNFFDFIKDTL